LISDKDLTNQDVAVDNVPGHADDTAGHDASEVFPRSEEPGVRSAVAERQSKPLTASHCDICACFTRRVKYC